MARVRGPAALKIIGRVFTALGLSALLVAGALYAQRHASLEGRARAEGRVVDLKRHSRGGYHPVYEFTASDGSIVRVESGIGSNPPRFHLGDIVPVLYPAADPQDALIDEFWSLWFGPVLAAIFGGLFSLIGAGMLIGSRG